MTEEYKLYMGSIFYPFDRSFDRRGEVFMTTDHAIAKSSDEAKDILTKRHHKATDIRVSELIIQGYRITARPSKQKTSGYEGCGSVAGANLFGKVNRSKSIIVRAQNAKGEHFELRATRLLAKVIQHEYDHLDGLVFIDRVTDTKSLMSRNEYLKKSQKK